MFYNKNHKVLNQICKSLQKKKIIKLMSLVILFLPTKSSQTYYWLTELKLDSHPTVKTHPPWLFSRTHAETIKFSSHGQYAKTILVIFETSNKWVRTVRPDMSLWMMFYPCFVALLAHITHQSSKLWSQYVWS